MKRKHIVHHKRKIVKPTERYLIVVRSWMLLVMFAIMLGVGAVVGTYLNAQSTANTPVVAGAQVEVQ